MMYARVKGITEKNKPNDPVSKQIDNLACSDDVCNWIVFWIIGIAKNYRWESYHLPNSFLRHVNGNCGLQHVK